MNDRIFVTGATGNVGREVVKNLVDKGAEVIGARLHGKDVVDQPGLTYRAFDFTSKDTWGACLEGVTKVFLMRPPHISRVKRDMLPFMKELQRRQVRQVVFLSVQGAENNPIVPHAKVERYCIDLDLPYTFIRPSFFMQNLTRTHIREIRDERRLFVPTGRGRTNFIDVRDIGEIISQVLVEPGHLGKAYTVTGTTSYSYAEVAEHLSQGLGVRIDLVNPGPFRFLAYHLRKRRKLAMAMVMLALYSVVKSGNGDITTSTTQEILGRLPIDLDRFVADHRKLLSGE